MMVDALFEANRTALNLERSRIEAAAHNIALANTPLAPGQAARLQQADFAALLADPGSSASLIGEVEVPVRTVHDPHHPLADGDGQVRYPEVDLVDQMTTLMSANRGYEANVRSLNLLRSMVLKALEIGRG